MNRSSARTMTGLAFLAVATLAAAAACSTTPVEALPNPAPSPAYSSIAPTHPIATPSTSPTSSKRSQSAIRPPACLGAVLYTFDTTSKVPRWPALCISIGGVLRLANHGPEGISENPTDKTSCFYEAGVHECRLIRTGTVRFTVVNSTGTRTLTLTIAGSSPGPAPACVSKGATYVLDVPNGGPPWEAICMKIGAVLRLENHGPDGFSIAPSGVASCQYEAGVRECRFLKSGTVTFTFTFADGGVRPFTVVAIK